jgi:hypothetical protein
MGGTEVVELRCREEFVMLILGSDYGIPCVFADTGTLRTTQLVLGAVARNQAALALNVPPVLTGGCAFSGN